ncbi:MAG: hypothetical protein FWD61_01080 [Phycisphaerales bacterium]|nr:hypothetical protein [Phycisphaerales bacterium]
MQTPRKTQQGTNLTDNAVARKVLEEIQKIETEAKQKKLEQLESLQQAKTSILDRMEELNHQLSQIEDAIMTITGSKRVPASQPQQKRTYRNLDEVRERVARWLEARKGEKFMAGDLVKEFPELDGFKISLFLKPLTLAGTVKTDDSEGHRRMRYYV